jgi:spore coat protein A, manganese oxidase
MGMTRRDAIKLGLVAGGGLVAPFGFGQSAWAAVRCQPGGAPSAPFSPQLKRFTLPLPLPPRLSPKQSTIDTDCYEIEVQETLIQIATERQDNIPIVLKFPVWGMRGNGLPDFISPGPLIRQRGGGRARGGRQSMIRFINHLPEVPTVPGVTPLQACQIHTPGNPNRNSFVVHLHGMNSLPYYDGYALDCIPTNHYKDYVYPNDSQGTLWYHDHSMDRTAENVYGGLAGMYLVETDEEQGIGLPDEAHDIPLMIQDRSFDSAGNVRCFNANNHMNFYGDVILVNGAPFPVLEVERRPYRFRLLNASLSRSYQLALSQPNIERSVGGVIAVIGTDEGFLPSPVYVDGHCQMIALGVAERYDIVIDFSNYESGEVVYLKNIGFTGIVDSDDRVQTVMQFKILAGDPVPQKLPTTLPSEFREIPVSQAIRTRTFRFNRSGNLWTINGKTWDVNRLDANPAVNDVEIWEFINPGGGWVHPVHPHLVRFRILDRNGVPPPCYQQGWKDVVLVGEFQRVRVLAQFSPHAGRYMMHCHNLIHEDHAMMTQFEVGTGGVSPLSKPALPIPATLPEMQPPPWVEVPLPPIAAPPQPCTPKGCSKR